MKRLNESGIALVIVLWMLLILLILASEMSGFTRSDVRAATNWKDSREASWLARAGVQMAVAEIMQDADYHYLIEGQGVAFGLVGVEALQNDEGRRQIPLGNGFVSYYIEDEYGKLNINQLAISQDRLIVMLMALFPEMAEDEIAVISDSIQDWVDRDDLTHAEGAEDEYYESLEEPYHAKNGEFESISELILVRGITPDMLPMFEKSLTVYPVQSLNLNTAPIEVLLASGLAVDEAYDIINIRSPDGWYADAMKSDIFTIMAEAGWQDGKSASRVKAVVRKNVDGTATFLAYFPSWMGRLPEAVKVDNLE